jgi:hypothetical protein
VCHAKGEVVKDLLDWNVIYFNSFRTNSEYTHISWTNIKMLVDSSVFLFIPMLNAFLPYSLSVSM